MSRQLTVRGVPDDVASRLERVSRARRQSVNATVKQILEDAVGSERRLDHLRRYATWSDADLAEFSAALEGLRTVDAKAWG
jgi:plasmid stability protein